MGIKTLIIKIVEFFRRNEEGANMPYVRGDSGSGHMKEASTYSPAGTDAPPLAEDAACIVQGESTGLYFNLGVLDHRNAGEAEPGEHRIYSRDVEGNVRATIHLHKDGKIRIFNSTGSFEISAAGVINANGVTIDPAGNLVVNGVDFATHTHQFVETGTPGTYTTGVAQ